MCIQPSPIEYFFPQASEIIPGLFVSDLYTATSPAVLSRLGVTHVLSVLRTPGLTFPQPLQHLTIPIDDTSDAFLLDHLDDAVRWIRDALGPNQEDGAEGGQGGHVLVHCVWGMSRSASVVVAFLIAARGMPLYAALRILRARRPVARPNEGFMAQLQAFERATRLRETRARENSADVHRMETGTEVCLPAESGRRDEVRSRSVAH